MKKIDVKVLLACMFCATIAYFVGRSSVSNHSEITPEDSTSTSVVSDNAGTVIPDTIPEKSVWIYNVEQDCVYELRVLDCPYWKQVGTSDGTVITNVSNYFVNKGKETLPATVTTKMTSEMKVIDGNNAIQYYDWVFKTSNKTYKHRDSLMINISLYTPKSVLLDYAF